MIDELPGDQVRVGTLLSALGDEGLLLIVILLSAIFIIPVSIPGLSTVFGASILLIGLSRCAAARCGCRRSWRAARSTPTS